MADMRRIGVTSPENLYAMFQDFLTRQQLGPQLRYNYPNRRPIEEVSPHRVKVKNDTEETIPAYACMRITGVEVVGGQTCIKVEKPSSTEGEFLFNSQYAIEAEAVATETEPAKTGVGWAYRYGVVTMLGDEPTEPGAAFGPIVGSWEIEEGGDKFVVFGRHDFSERALVGRFNAGSGGGHSIWFEIESVICNADDSKTLFVTPTYYTGGCTRTIPGEDEYGQIQVEDPCSILAFYTQDFLESGGVKGRATYMYPRGAEYCEPVWLVDQICGQPECA